MELAEPAFRPYLCRDYVAEYGVLYVRWDDSTGAEQTADAAERMLGF